MKKISYPILASAMTLTAASASAQSAYDHPGYYIGVAANATTLSGQQKNTVATVVGGAVNGIPGGKTSTDTGFGGSLFAGYKIKMAQHFNIIPEVGLEKDSAKNTFRVFSANDIYKATLKRRFSAYLTAALSFDVTETFTLNVPFGIKYANIKYTAHSTEAGVAKSASQGVGAIGYTLGFGVEKRFECFSLGAVISHAIYQSSRVKVAVGDENFSTKVPSETQFSLRFKLPFAAL